MTVIKKIRLIAFCVLLLLLLLLLGFEAFRFFAEGAVSHRDLKESVASESAAIQVRLDARCDALERKLDRIESKLDRLIDLATPKLPDGMRAVE
ncbi:MAG: hypothetical protein IKF72_13435 [Kiritimatiellae bacterium]|nr:hypothetical protein [Kiritimatiellia bacterium]